MHTGPENLKKSRPKKSWIQINQKNIFVKLHFWQFETFSQFKKWFLAPQKIREIDLFDFTVFFWPGIFFNFLAHCEARLFHEYFFSISDSFCPRCNCKYQTRSLTVIKVVVILVIWVISLLLFYMAFLSILEPMLSKKRGIGLPPSIRGQGVAYRYVKYIFKNQEFQMFFYVKL